MGKIDDQNRNTNMNDKDHLVGQLTGLNIPLCSHCFGGHKWRQIKGCKVFLLHIMKNFLQLTRFPGLPGNFKPSSQILCWRNEECFNQNCCNCEPAFLYQMIIDNWIIEWWQLMFQPKGLQLWCSLSLSNDTADNWKQVVFTWKLTEK